MEMENSEFDLKMAGIDIYTLDSMDASVVVVDVCLRMLLTLEMKPSMYVLVLRQWFKGCVHKQVVANESGRAYSEASRAEAVDNIESTIHDLGNTFTQLATMVSQQGELAIRITGHWNVSTGVDVDYASHIQTIDGLVKNRVLTGCVQGFCPVGGFSVLVQRVYSVGVFSELSLKGFWLQKCISSAKIDACGEITDYLLGLIREEKSKYE
ncbi:putative syntaxin [Tanacetum coccineum]